MSVEIDLSAELHGHVLEYVADLDRAWFADHPGETVRYREAVEHEWCDPTAAPLCRAVFRPPPVPPGMTAVLMVAVRQLAPGLRARAPYFAIQVGEAA